MRTTIGRVKGTAPPASSQLVSPFALCNSLRPCEYSLPIAITEAQTMANQEQLDILKQGATAWNQWRVQNLGKRVGPNTSVNIHRGPGQRSLTWVARNCVDLVRAELIGCDLAGVDFTGVNLTGANLQGSDLCRANLFGANLYGVRFTTAVLSRADFTNALVGLTEFVRVDLSDVAGLECARHASPSTIDIDTIYKSKGKIPEVFLRGAGVPEDFIVYMRALAGWRRASAALRFMSLAPPHDRS